MIETYVSIGKVTDYAIGVLKYFATASSILLISIIGALMAWIFLSAVGMIVAILGIIVSTIVEGRGKTTNLENVNTAIAAVTEAYPELKSNENYKELMNELSITENLISGYRENYNKQIKEYNRYIRKFPTRLFLNLLGYEARHYEYLNYDAPVDAPQNLFGD